MRTHMRRLALCLMMLVVLSVATVAPECWAEADANEIPFSRARIIIEFNATAQDVGLQVLLDGEPWRRVTIFSPNERRLLTITATGSLRKQGLTELFFESSEPSLDEVPLAVFLARFPAGVYEFAGVTVDGVELEGEAVLSHVIPAGPVIIMPVQSPDNPPVVDPDNLVIEWEPVTTSITGTGLNIVGYQVIVEQVAPLRVLSIDLPPITSVKIPPEFFLQRDALHKFEVLAIDVSGNQTITEGSFVTAP